MKAQDRIFEAYLNGMGEAFGQKVRERIHWICENVYGKNILDIGCSQGISDILLARESKQVLAIDVLQESIDYANEKLQEEAVEVQSNVQFVRANFLDYNLGNKMFDTIIMTEVLEHLVDPGAFIDKALGHLQEEGRLIITVPFGINDYFDHKRTYYCNGMLELLRDKVSIENVEFMGKWIGFIAVRSNEKKAFSLETILNKMEENFYGIERELLTSNANKDLTIKQNYKVVEELKTKNQELAQDNRKNIQQIQDAEKEIKLKEEEIQKRITQVDRIEGSYSELEGSYTELEGSYTKLKGNYDELKELMQSKQQEKELLIEKVVDYLAKMEKLVDENEAIGQKRQTLIDRTEELYANNQKLVAQLKEVKDKYRALSGSKLGKLTMFIWRLKKKIKRR